MLASYINPPLTTVKLATPRLNSPTVVASFRPPLAPAELPDVEAVAEAPAVIATALACALKAKLPRGEFVEGPLVLKKDNHAVGLPSQLQPNGQLRHRGIADMLAVNENPAATPGAADTHTGAANRWENGIPVAPVEETAAFTCVTKHICGFLELVRPGWTGQAKYDESNHQTRYQVFHIFNFICWFDLKHKECWHDRDAPKGAN